MIGIDQGVGPQSLQGASSNSAGWSAYAPEIYETPVLDLLRTYSNVELLPGRPGFVPWLVSSGLVTWTTTSIVRGTQTSPPTVRAGSDANHSNFLSSSTTPNNANQNAVINPPFCGLGPVRATVGTRLVPGLPVYFDVTSPAAGTGGYQCSAKLTVIVVWIPVAV